MTRGQLRLHWGGIYLLIFKPEVDLLDCNIRFYYDDNEKDIGRNEFIAVWEFHIWQSDNKKSLVFFTIE